MQKPNLSLSAGQCPIPATSGNVGETALVDFAATHSPFLRDLSQRHSDFLSRNLDAHFADVTGALLAQVAGPFNDQRALRNTLRITRQQLMLYLGLCEIGSVASLEATTGALSAFADACLNAALAFELSQMAARGLIVLPEGENENAQPSALETRLQRCGMCILGLGKLGGRELNYSSDIDLIIIFDKAHFPAAEGQDKQNIATKLAQKVSGHLSANTDQGFVFRVDLRLRPDPSSTPIAVSIDAAEAYYQTTGQTWERSALIKARHCAGDQRVSDDFLGRVRPFIWRRHLDFAAIDDIRLMKARVHNHHHHEVGPPGPGFDVKLGYGGIREIEFFAQIHQLIMGGRRADLQQRPTIAVLDALLAAGDIDAEDRAALSAAYTFLRMIEHRAQMVSDAQTHEIPKQPEALAQFACFAGFQEADALLRELAAHVSAVSQRFINLMADAPEDTTPARTCAFAGSPEFLAAAQRWRAGEYRALRTGRAQALLETLMSEFAAAFEATREPREALSGFDGFLSQISSGVQFLSLLTANRPLIGLLARIMGEAPELRAALQRTPSLFEALITEDLHDPTSPLEHLKQDLERTLSASDDYETMLDLARIWTNEARFHVGVRLLEGLETPENAREAYVRIAESCVGVLAAQIQTHFAATHGAIEGGAFGVIALGSFGARELGPDSDLDLTFLYDAPPDVTSSDGPKPLTVRTYYTRLSQRLITSITTLTGEGRLYEVDMRLRPSGRSGIIAVSLEAFCDYHKEKSWTWEAMSLTKARLIHGPAALKGAFLKVRADGLRHAAQRGQIKAAVWDMRNKLRASDPQAKSYWSLKMAQGGMRDADFLVEGLILGAPDRVSDDSLQRATTWPQWASELATNGTFTPGTHAQLAAAQRLLLDARTTRHLLTPRQEDFSHAAPVTQDRLAHLLGFDTLADVVTAINDARARLYGALLDLLAPETNPPDRAE